MPAAISVSNLSKSFGKHAILEGCAFAVGEGEAFGLAGLNGAGKTTLIRLLLGVLRADKGELAVLGEDPWLHHASLHRRMGVVLDHDGMWGNLTLEQNMKIFSAAKGVSWSSALSYMEEYWSRTPIYGNRRAVKFFSRGQRMQCALCRAFLGWPSLYLFDEPAVALDVDAYEHFTKMVALARARGASILISSHQLEAIDDLADRVGMLRDGRIVELPGRAEHRGRRWSIAADDNPRWGEIIRQQCGNLALYSEGEWRFESANAAADIPAIVRLLAIEGCAIRGVSPVVEEFSNAIRNEYRRRAAGEDTVGGKEP
jgi:ABC-2 type transport system ATP-binding protein